MLLPSMLRVLLTRSFKPFVFVNINAPRLAYHDLENLGLYVHIPFCGAICDFCPYFKAAYDAELAQKYLGALLREIDIVCSGQTGKKTVTSLYFGGGTPAVMLAGVAKIINKLEEYFHIKDGIGVELHPGDICGDTLSALKAAGVSMVSVGIQSFDKTCLSALGRTLDNFAEKLELVRSYGFPVVDVDLIFGIPGQTEGNLINDMALAYAHGATQVSTYPFIDFTFAHNRYKPLPEKAKRKMLAAITEYAADNGIRRTAVWTFAKEGAKKYSSVTRDNFLGFGASAATLLRHSFKVNTFSIPDYIKRVDENLLPTSLTLTFTKRQRACYYLFWACYSARIDAAAFEDVIGEPLKRMYGAELRLAEILGIMKKEGGGYRLTEKGAYFYHKMEQAYTAAYIDKSWKILREQAFPKRIVLK